MRTEKDLQDQYSKYCVQIGDLIWKVQRLQADLERLYVQVRALDQEFIQITRTPDEDTTLENDQETKAP